MLYSDEALHALLCKYVLSEAGEEERLWVEEWLQSNPEHPQLLCSLEKVLAEIPRREHTPNTELAWQRLSAKIPGQRKFKMWWMAAATLLLIAGGWWTMVREGRTQIFTGPLLAQLDDGSSIKLDSGTQLQVLPGFGKRQRLVKLKGKAVFNVTHGAVHPFIVRLGDQEVKVLGTQFMIDYRDHLRVHVNSGRVMVINGKDSVLLSTGMLLESVKGVFNTAAHVINADKKELVFSDTPLREVLQTIGVVYDKKITADSVLLQLPVTATFTGESAENVLAAIAYMTNTIVVQYSTGTVLRSMKNKI